MSIDHAIFLSWAENHFGPENIRLRGDEICANSPFIEDNKFHLWMNPSGGKKNRLKGVFRCWYTDRKGDLPSLVSELDHIDYDEAEELLTGTTSLRLLEKQLEQFFESKPEEIPAEIHLDLPTSSVLIDSLPENNAWKNKATEYLTSRKIPTTSLYICTNNKDYKNRIIIPYYDMYGRIIYFNSRSMNDEGLRYKKPEVGNQTDVLFVPKWPRPESKIYLTEGEFDAISLHLCGFYSAACGGKEISESQTELLRANKICLAFDTDGGNDVGGAALLKNGQKLLNKGLEEVYYVRPPKGFKDWNKLLVEKNEETIRKYIKHYEKRFTTFTVEKLISQQAF